MDSANVKPELEHSRPSIVQLPGEPAILINGVPEMPHSDGSVAPVSNGHDCESVRSVEVLGDIGLGEWLAGREVVKVVGMQYIRGKVSDCDKESGLYRVVYDGGDFECLDWSALEKILVPLDVSIPLKSLASKIIRRTAHTSGRTTSQYEISKV